MKTLSLSLLDLAVRSDSGVFTLQFTRRSDKTLLLGGYFEAAGTSFDRGGDADCIGGSES